MGVGGCVWVCVCGARHLFEAGCLKKVIIPGGDVSSPHSATRHALGDTPHK